MIINQPTAIYLLSLLRVHSIINLIYSLKNSHSLCLHESLMISYLKLNVVMGQQSTWTTLFTYVWVLLISLYIRSHRKSRVKQGLDRVCIINLNIECFLMFPSHQYSQSSLGLKVSLDMSSKQFTIRVELDTDNKVSWLESMSNQRKMYQINKNTWILSSVNITLFFK